MEGRLKTEEFIENLQRALSYLGRDYESTLGIQDIGHQE